MLSDQAKINYIKSPVHCPYCGSQDIEGGTMDYDEPMTEEVTCNSCKKTWSDIYKVVDIIEN